MLGIASEEARLEHAWEVDAFRRLRGCNGQAVRSIAGKGLVECGDLS